MASCELELLQYDQSAKNTQDTVQKRLGQKYRACYSLE